MPLTNQEEEREQVYTGDTNGGNWGSTTLRSIRQMEFEVGVEEGPPWLKHWCYQDWIVLY